MFVVLVLNIKISITFENDTIKLLVNEAKLNGLWARNCYISQQVLSIKMMCLRVRKVTGPLSRNGSQICSCLKWSSRLVFAGQKCFVENTFCIKYVGFTSPGHKHTWANVPSHTSNTVTKGAENVYDQFAIQKQCGTWTPLSTKCCSFRKSLPHDHTPLLPRDLSFFRKDITSNSNSIKRLNSNLLFFHG